MRALGVFKAIPVINDLVGLKNVRDLVQIDCLLLHESLKAFDEDVVKLAIASTHQDFDIYSGQDRDPIRGHVLVALVRVHHLEFAIFCDCRL